MNGQRQADPRCPSDGVGAVAVGTSAAINLLVTRGDVVKPVKVLHNTKYVTLL